MLHKLFLPKSKKRSPILSIEILFLANVVMMLLIFSRIASLRNHDLHILGFATDINTKALLEQTNSQRQENGLSALSYNNVLSNAAYQKAQDMFDDDYWAHVAPDGKTPWDFIIQNGYKYSYAGENLAKDFNKSSSVVSAWMNSPSHRANILNPNYTEIGFAVVNGTLSGEETTLVVQMFGQPESGVVKNDSVAVPDKVTLANVATENTVDQQPALIEKNQGDSPVVISNDSAQTILTDTPANIDLITINTDYIKYFAYLIFGIFSFSLVVDGVVAYKREHLRITGNTVFHLMLFLFSIFFIYYLNNPQIL